MKKLLYAALLLLLLALSVSGLAESVIEPMTDDELVDYLATYLVDSGFGYANATLNSEENTIFIDAAVDGFAEAVLLSKVYRNIMPADMAAQFDNSWNSIKSSMDAIHLMLLATVELYGNEDMKLVFRLVNDEMYIHNNYENSQYDVLLEIGTEGNVTFDILR